MRPSLKYFTFIFLFSSHWLSSQTVQMFITSLTFLGNLLSFWSFLNAGFVWQEIKQMWDEGILEYTRDWWNLLDYVMNSLYITVIGLRVTAYLNVSMSYREHKVPAFIKQGINFINDAPQFFFLYFYLEFFHDTLRSTRTDRWAL